MAQELELVEENSTSCPSGMTSTGIPMWMLAIIGVTMMVGIVMVTGEEKKPGIGGTI
jgi:hypothetical protein